jgi:hypothetical protein
MEKQKHRARHRENRKNPCGPCRCQRIARASQLNGSQSKQHHREGFVLKNFLIGDDALDPRLGAKRPQLCVAEHQDKGTGKQKAERPRIAGDGEAIAEGKFCKNKDACKNQKETSEVVVELALLFVAEQLRLLGRIQWGVHGHGRVVMMLVSVGRLRPRQGDGKGCEQQHQ